MALTLGASVFKMRAGLRVTDMRDDESGAGSPAFGTTGMGRILE